MMQYVDPTLVIVHDRCLVDVSGLLDSCNKIANSTRENNEVEIPHGGWERSLVEVPLPKVLVSSARSSGERRLARQGPINVSASGMYFTLSLTKIDEDVYRRYYEGFVNPIMWKLHHGLLLRNSFCETGRVSYVEEYRKVNIDTARNVGHQVLDVSGPVTIFWQDYQWYLAPLIVRRWLNLAGRSGVAMHHFVHVPFPEVSIWRACLPEFVVRELLNGLLANDLIGFQTAESVRNFLHCCSSFLGYRIDELFGTVETSLDRYTFVRAYPIPINSRRLTEIAGSAAARRAVDELRRQVGPRKLVFRTERVDPSKNFLGSLHAYARVLNDSGLSGRVVYAARLVPSRQSVPEWFALRQRICEEVCRLNEEFGTDDWKPVQVDLSEDLTRAVAGYILYDVLDIVPYADGMNQVSLEGPLVNRSKGVLVLSRTAGSYGILKRYCLGVEPRNVGEHAAALRSALAMDLESRRRTSEKLRTISAKGNPLAWILAQIEDVRRIVHGGIPK